VTSTDLPNILVGDLLVFDKDPMFISFHLQYLIDLFHKTGPFLVVGIDTRDTLPSCRTNREVRILAGGKIHFASLWELRNHFRPVLNVV
jgi:hypothetical protein